MHSRSVMEKLLFVSFLDWSETKGREIRYAKYFFLNIFWRSRLQCNWKMDECVKIKRVMPVAKFPKLVNEAVCSGDWSWVPVILMNCSKYWRFPLYVIMYNMIALSRWTPCLFCFPWLRTTLIQQCIYLLSLQNLPVYLCSIYSLSLQPPFVLVVASTCCLCSIYLLSL